MAYFTSIEDPLKKKKLPQPSTSTAAQLTSKQVTTPTVKGATPTTLPTTQKPVPTPRLAQPVLPKPAPQPSPAPAPPPLPPPPPQPAVTSGSTSSGFARGGEEEDDGGIVVNGRSYDEPNTVQNGGGRNGSRSETSARDRAIEEARDRAIQDRLDGGGQFGSDPRGVFNPDDVREDIEQGQQDNRGVTPDESDIGPFDNFVGDGTSGNGERDINDIIEDFVRDGVQGDTYDDVTLDADPFKDVKIGHKGDDELLAMVRAFAASNLDPKASDTGDEEAYINDRVNAMLGKQLVGQRASMGRAGFGASGALGGLENDARRAANLDAAGQIYDVREREQEQALRRGQIGAGLANDRDDTTYGRAVDNAELSFRNQGERYDRATDQADLDHRNQTTDFGQRVSAADLDMRMQSGARQDAILKMQVDAINELLNPEDDPNEPPDPRDTDNSGDVSPDEAGLADVADDRVFAEGAPKDADRYEEWTDPEGLPWGFRTGDDGEYVYTMGFDGRLWKTPVARHGDGGTG